MKLYYVSVNNWENARLILRSLLEEELAICVNWFALPYVYGWQQDITQHPKIALIIKTEDDCQDAIEQTIRQHLGNTNSLTEISLTNVDQDFLDWLSVQISPQFLSTTYVQSITTS